MIKKRISVVSLLLVTSLSLLAQSNSYPTAGDVGIFNYSPLLVLQRNTDEGGFIQGVQTKFKNGTNNWYFGNLHSDSWIVSKGDYQNPKFTILQNGNVGIGTTSPNATLQIGDSNNSGNPTVETEIKRLSLAPVTHSGSDWFFTTRDNNPYANLDIGYSSNKTITLRHDGNVGIGSTNPTSKLTVAGNINSREVKVSVDAGADFVFEKDYALPSLQEVEKFVTKNKHLPEIASAKEMQKEGINLSEMNIKLLQKIEELTLYMIEQNKRIELQQKENNIQSAAIETLKKENETFKNLSERFSKIESQLKTAN
nr:tail fiber protein [uncultured Flavobacterium sp.]